MAEDSEAETGADDAPETKPKSGGRKLLLMLGSALLFGGAGFYATSSGMVASPFGGAGDDDGAKAAPAAAPLDVAYLQLDELVVPLSPRARSRFLVFRAAIEVDAADLQAIETVAPRIADVLNTYLRAVDESDLEEPSAMPLLRARLLRRVIAAAEPVAPRDLLITTFVLK